eukprot:3288799-Prymnesium_polylepis.1
MPSGLIALSVPLTTDDMFASLACCERSRGARKGTTGHTEMERPARVRKRVAARPKSDPRLRAEL